MTNEGEIYFALYGENLSPDEATQIIGLAPTTTKEANPLSRRPGVWMFSTGKLCGEPLDLIEAASRLVDHLVPFESAILSARSKLSLTPVLQVVLTISTDEALSTPILGFGPKVISFLNAVGAAIDVDLYRD